MLGRAVQILVMIGWAFPNHIKLLTSQPSGIGESFNRLLVHRTCSVTLRPVLMNYYCACTPSRIMEFSVKLYGAADIDGLGVNT